MLDDDPRTDAQLLAETAGEPEAFGRFYRRHVRWVLAICAWRAEDPELAADVTAEAFATALARSDRFDPQTGGAPGNWLFTIALDTLADARRRGCAQRRARAGLGIPAIVLTREDRRRIGELASLAGDGAGVALLAEPDDAAGSGDAGGRRACHEDRLQRALVAAASARRLPAAGTRRLRGDRA